MTSAALQPWWRTDWTGGDSTAPGVTITFGPTSARISRVVGKDQTSVAIQSDEAFVDYQVRVVPGSSSPVTAGTRVEGGLPLNGSFETDLSGWQVGKGNVGVPNYTTWARESGWSSDGTWSLRMTHSTVTANQYIQTLPIFTSAVQHDAGLIPCAAGVVPVAKFDANVLSFTGTGTIAPGLYYLNSVGGYLGHGLFGANLSFGVQTVTMTPTAAPANTAFAAVALPINGGASSGGADWYVDNLRWTYPASATFAITVGDDELVAAGGASGDNIVKVFVKDAAGNWSL